MSISTNITQVYQIKNIIHDNLITSKNLISNIANKILKYTPLIAGMIQVGIVLASSYQVQGAVAVDDQAPTSTPELDEVITVRLNNGLPSNIMRCGLFSSLC